MKLKDISIKTKLVSIFAFFILVFLSFGLFCHVVSLEISKSGEHLPKDYEIVALILGSASKFGELIMPVNDYVSTGSFNERLNFERASKEANVTLDELRKKITEHARETGAVQQAYLNSLDSMERTLRDIILISGQVMSDPNPVGKQDLIDKMKQVDALLLDMNIDISKLADVTQAEIAMTKLKMSSTLSRVKWTIAGVSAFVIILNIMLMVLVQYTVIKRLAGLIAGVKEFGIGDFSHVFEESKDEIGVLAHSFNEMSGSIKKSQKALAEENTKDKALHDLLRKLGASLEMESTMRAITDTVREIFPAVTVSYITAPIIAKNTPHLVYVHAPCGVGERYLGEIKDMLLLGLDTLPTLKAVAPIFEKWRSAEFDTIIITGEKNLELDDAPRSSVNIPLIIPQSVAGIFNFSSEKDGVFGKTEIDMLYSIISYASETVERIQNLIENEEHRLANLIESIGDGVVVVDRNWNITLMNKMASQISGFAEKEAVGRAFKDVMKFVRERDRKEDISFIEKAMAENITQSTAEQMILVSKDGREVPIGDSAAPFVDQSGYVVGAVIVFRDTTMERQAQGLKSDFAYASHQLRTPVSKAMWNLEVALETDDVEKLKSATHVAYDSMRSVQKLVEELLDVSRIDQGQILVEKDRIFVQDIISDAVHKTKKTIDALHVKLMEGVIDNIGINTNKKLLVSAMSIILENASIYNHVDGRIEVKAQRQGDNVLIEIIDNGIGITEEHNPLVFTKFFRGNNFDTTAIAGAGLGLYIAKEYISLLGGKIWFKSEEGKGTTFFLLLPTG